MNVVDNQMLKAVKLYAGRKMTIRQLANKYDVSYEKMRGTLVSAGYSNGLKKR